MSSGTVRAQMQSFLAAGNVTGMEKWYLAEPWFAPASDWNLAANNGWGAIGWPWISDESETRETLGAIVGQKVVTYKVRVVLLYQYLIPATPTSEDAYIGPLDTLVEGVKARLRSDPKAGTGPGLDGVIFEQSQEPGDLNVLRDLPQKLPGKIVVWQGIDTTVKEIITA